MADETQTEKTEVQKAEEILLRITEENKKSAELLKAHQELEARRILGGRSEAGTAPIPPKIETPKEYKDRILRGG